MTKSTRKSLVIVESPAKAKTINKYLGSDFDVKSSMGHIRDLPISRLGVDIENGFEPTYVVSRGKERTVRSLKAAAKKCSDLYLATDLDREGEAIAWHLAQLLGISEEKTYRVIFNAITKSAITRAFSDAGKINMDKVMAQQARRILDRIVGYQISPLLWKKIARGLSAGRVQSVAVKMIVEREREIRQFEPEEYWLIPAVFTADLKNDYAQQWQRFIAADTPDSKAPALTEQNKWLAEHNAFRAQLIEIGGRKFKVSERKGAEQIFDALKKAEFKIVDLESKQSLSRPGAPFITSTIQQAASNQLGFAAKRTMRVAQQLYEGLDLGSMGSLGLITYMRTDSTHIADEAVKEVRNYIGSHFGKDYLPLKPNKYSSKKTAQQAHEAIRPTDVDLTPPDIKQFLSDEQFKLYELIWRRFVACQMAPAKWDVTNIKITAETSCGTCFYKAGGRVLIFDGYSRVWPVTSEQQRLPAVKPGQKLAVVDLKAEQHFTKPPARYNEASLVKSLEREGIGRPSTYATIISTIQERGYVEQTNRKFFATDLGQIVTDKLSEYFPKIMDIAFTRHMEEQLDEIEEQHLDWLVVLKEFYGPFKQNLDVAGEQMKHAKAETSPSEYECPKCGQKLVYRFGKKGRFLSCSAYPKCKFACPCDRDGKMVKEKTSEHKCPVCGKGMVYKSGRYGPFLGCSDYPACKTTLKLDKQGNVLPAKPAPEKTGIRCYKCKQGELVIRQSKKGSFLGCNRFPKCRTIVSIKKLEMLKQLQQAGQWPPEKIEQAKEILGSKTTKKPKRENDSAK
ncbi:MAG: type I DNA topoisomerase [Sedimentisphaerales bacterium]|nr:type I DNA topoisomerase [Sedimentisphaerales bacterium]